MREYDDVTWIVRMIAEGEALLDAESIKQICKQMKVDLGEMFCICMSYADAEHVVTDIQRVTRLRKTCIHAAKKLKLQHYCYIGTGFTVVLVIVGSKQERSWMSQKLFDIISPRIDCPICMGVGMPYDSVEKLSYSRVEAIEAVGSSKLNESIVFIEDIYVSRSITQRKLDGQKRKIVEYFKKGEMKRVADCMTQLAENARVEAPVREGMPYPTSIRRTVLEVLFDIMHISSDMGIDVDSVVGCQDPYSLIFEIDDTPVLLAWVLGIIQALYQALVEQNSKTEKNMLVSAKQCINEYLHDPELSLSLVGEKLGITATYLSAFFIREEGVGFNEYITNIRVNKAKNLLDETNKKIREIASECGFRSSSYFISVFRKHCGVSPKEYRDMK